MAEGLISDPETDKIVAIIRGGGVYRFHNDTEGAEIATVVGSCVYDLHGNLIGSLVGYLHGQHVIDPSTQSMPVAFTELIGAPLAKENFRSIARLTSATMPLIILGMGKHEDDPL